MNALGDYGRWAFAEFTDVFDIEPNLRQVIESHQREYGRTRLTIAVSVSRTAGIRSDI